MNYLPIEIADNIIDFIDKKHYKKLLIELTLVSKNFLSIRNQFEIIININSKNISNVIKILFYTNYNTYFKMHLHNVCYVLYELVNHFKITNIVGLYFDDNFNSVVNYLPPELEYIIFGSNFNQLVDNIPNSVKYISLSWQYNKKINRYPSSLKYLTINLKEVNMDTVFPYNIECLTLNGGHHYNHCIINYLVPKLINLKILNIYQCNCVDDDLLNKLILKGILINDLNYYYFDQIDQLKQFKLVKTNLI